MMLDPKIAFGALSWEKAKLSNFIKSKSKAGKMHTLA